MEFWQEFLPTQPEYAKHGPAVRTNTEYEKKLFEFVGEFNGLPDYRHLDLQVPQNVPVEAMASNPVTLALLRQLVSLHKPRRVVEFGTYIGVSAITMALAMPQGGNLITVEKGHYFASFASKNIKHNIPLSWPVCVAVKEGDALTLVHEWAFAFPETQDLIFLDADKEHYADYLEPIQRLMAPGGVLVVDDVLFHGDVLNDRPNTAKGRGAKDLLERAKTLYWSRVLLPLGNGVLIMQKP